MKTIISKTYVNIIGGLYGGLMGLTIILSFIGIFDGFTTFCAQKVN